MPRPERVLPTLGRVLRAAREDQGLSQEQLGEETGIHRNYIGGIERGERSPSVETISRLAGALHVSLSDLFARAERLGARSFMDDRGPLPHG